MKQIKNMLIDNKIKIANGMTEEELKNAEEIYQIKFPREYRDMLKEFVLDSCNWNDFLKEYKINNSIDEITKKYIDIFLSSTSEEGIEAYDDISCID